MLHFSSTSIPTSFSTGLLSIHSSTGLYWYWELPWHRCRTLRLVLLNVEVHESPPFKPVKVLLDGIPPLKQINIPTQVGVICRLAEGALDSTMSLMKTSMDQEGHHLLLVSIWTLAVTLCTRPPSPVPYPANNPSVKSTSLQFRGKNIGPDCIKGLTEVQVDDICNPSLVHWCSHSIVEGH